MQIAFRMLLLFTTAKFLGATSFTLGGVVSGPAGSVGQTNRKSNSILNAICIKFILLSFGLLKLN